jgi:hypothetical protein
MLRAVAATLALLVAGGVAMAEPSERPGARKPTAGYRWQIAAADATALALAIGAGRAERGSEHADTLVLGSIAMYFAAAPLVHVAHGRERRAGASLALRVGSLFAGALIGKSACHCSSGPILGALGGALAASVVDTAALGGADKAKRESGWRPSITSSPRTLSIGTRAIAIGVRSDF